MAGGFGGGVVSERAHQYEYRITGYFVFAYIVAALGGFLLGYDHGVSGLCHLQYGIFLLFVCLIIIMSTFIFFLLPETKQVPIEEIYLLFQKHWFWKRIVGDGEQIGPNGKPSQPDGKSGAQV